MMTTELASGLGGKAILKLLTLNKATREIFKKYNKILMRNMGYEKFLINEDIRSASEKMKFLKALKIQAK